MLNSAELLSLLRLTKSTRLVRSGSEFMVSSMMLSAMEMKCAEIEAQFDCIHQNCPPGPLEDLVNYIETMWINGTYPLECWSIYGQPI